MVATIVHAADASLGYIAAIEVAADAIWAVGGQWSRPTMLRSVDGGATFARLALSKLPSCPGLRDAFVEGDALYVCGEQGYVGRTRDGGALWENLRAKNVLSRVTGAASCLYTIDRGPDGMLWVTGDDGLVERSKTGSRWTATPIKTPGRVLGLTRDPRDAKRPWLIDSAGLLHRYDPAKKAFVEVPAKAMRVKRPLCQLSRTLSGALVLIGDDGLIMRSVNDGAAWKKITNLPAVDYEHLVVTQFGIVVVGDDGTLLVSHDDAATFARVTAPALTGHLWSISIVADGILIGGSQGAIYRVGMRELAVLMRDGLAKREPVLAQLAGAVADGVDGAPLVLEDAMRERGLWV